MKPIPAITVLIVCLFEFLGLFLYPSAMFDDAAIRIGLWYQIYIAVSALVAIFVIWKLWKMYRLGVYVYFGMYIIHNLIAIIAGNWQISILIIPVIGAALLLPHYKKMKHKINKVLP